MTAAGRAVRTERASSTQEAILAAAERLYAEHGMFAVSNRQVSEAAGQGNNAAVGYHFGTKADLVRAIEQKHRGPVEQLREQMVAELVAIGRRRRDARLGGMPGAPAHRSPGRLWAIPPGTRASRRKR